MAQKMRVEKPTAAMFLAMHEACERFVSNDPLPLSELELEQFLTSTESIGMDRCMRLIFLANLLQTVGWTEICQVYKKAIKEESQDDLHERTYITWLNLSLNLWMLEGTNPNEQSRLEVANDTFNILIQCTELHPKHPGFTFLFGLYYYLHPLAQRSPSEYYGKAVDWLTNAAQLFAEEEARVDVATQVYLGHCHAALGQWKNAVEAYEAVTMEQIREECDEPEVRQIAAKIQECRARLTTGI